MNKSNGSSIKLLLIGLGAIFAFVQAGPMGLVLLGAALYFLM